MSDSEAASGLEDGSPGEMPADLAELPPDSPPPADDGMDWDYVCRGKSVEDAPAQWPYWRPMSPQQTKRLRKEQGYLFLPGPIAGSYLCYRRTGEMKDYGKCTVYLYKHQASGKAALVRCFPQGQLVFEVYMSFVAPEGVLEVALLSLTGSVAAVFKCEVAMEGIFTVKELQAAARQPLAPNM